MIKNTPVIGTIRSLHNNDLETILRWRNHPEVRRFMYTQHEISLEEHLQWFECVSQDPTRHLLIYEEGGDALGYINITVHKTGKIADWGFYLAPDAIKGTGKKLGKATQDYAFGPLELHKLCGQVLAYNKRSITFHLNQGFQQEGILREQYFDGHDYHSIVCFGLLKNEWCAQTKDDANG